MVEPVERLIGVRLPGASPSPPPVAQPDPDAALARIDAARDRLRATIEPPQDDAG